MPPKEHVAHFSICSPMRARIRKRRNPRNGNGALHGGIIATAANAVTAVPCPLRAKADAVTQYSTADLATAVVATAIPATDVTVARAIDTLSRNLPTKALCPYGVMIVFAHEIQLSSRPRHFIDNHVELYPRHAHRPFSRPSGHAGGGSGNRG